MIETDTVIPFDARIILYRCDNSVNSKKQKKKAAHLDLLYKRSQGKMSTHPGNTIDGGNRNGKLEKKTCRSFKAYRKHWKENGIKDFSVVLKENDIKDCSVVLHRCSDSSIPTLHAGKRNSRSIKKVNLKINSKTQKSSNRNYVMEVDREPKENSNSIDEVKIYANIIQLFNGAVLMCQTCLMTFGSPAAYLDHIERAHPSKQLSSNKELQQVVNGLREVSQLCASNSGGTSGRQLLRCKLCRGLFEHVIDYERHKSIVCTNSYTREELGNVDHSDHTVHTATVMHNQTNQAANINVCCRCGLHFKTIPELL